MNNRVPLNWCHASGSNNSTSVTTGPKQVDPNSLCNIITYQNTTTPPVSACFEHSDFATTYNNDPGKSGLNKASSPSVRWRLPTVYDYKQADVNGIRFVLPDMDYDAVIIFEWTATIVSNDRSHAWRFLTGYGNMLHDHRTSSFIIRCVGR